MFHYVVYESLPLAPIFWLIFHYTPKQHISLSDTIESIIS